MPLQRPARGPFQRLARLVLHWLREQKRRSQTHQNQPLKGNIMNIHKHMEAIFVVTLAIIAVGEFFFDSVPDADAKTSIAVASDTARPAAMPIVVVHAPKASRHA
ncbi:MAG: hypothetical protein ACXWC4_12370 [Telluria sp.]